MTTLKGSKLDSSNDPSMNLTAIRLCGFKCFRSETEARIAPLTILAGANSGGKSSLIQPLLLMKQTLEAPFDPGPLLLDGPLVKVEQAATLAWRGQARNDRAKQWWIETEGTENLRTTFSMGGKAGLTLESMGDRKAGIGHERVNVYMRPLFAVFRPNLFVDLIHLPGLRGNPERAYRLTQATERFPGPFQTYTAGVLLAWKEAKDERLAAVGNDLRALGLSWKVDLRRRGDTAVEVQIGRLPGPRQGGAMDTVNIADVGFGASQVLPVVVALQAARPGQVVHIEQPELHLHPKAQRLLADLLINAAKRKVIVIVETHSSVLLTAVQLRVADGTIPPDQVALHWFSRDEEGASHVRTAELEKNGAFGDWPVDFADVEMEVERDYINAAFGPEKA